MKKSINRHNLKQKAFKYLLFLGIFTCLSSCISTSKIVYVEDKDKNETTQTYTSQDWVYKIKPGDRFHIEVNDPLSNVSIGISGSTKLNESPQSSNIINQTPTIQDYLVKDNGKIDFPMLGEIDAEGKTITELIREVKESCKGYISNPSVKLFMTNYNITVLGEVNHPSAFQLITHNPSFFDAIGMANDLTDFADRSRVKIIRKDRNEISINYIDITDPAFISSPYYYLQPNDVIHVMPLKVKKYNRDNALPLLLSSIATILTIITLSSTK